jgi:hypothetical protein
VATWGVLLFLVSTPLALLAGNNVGRLKLAAQIVLVDGVAVAVVGIWCVRHTPMMPAPWLAAVIIGCCCGIAYCFYGLVDVGRVKAPTPDSVGYVAFFSAMMSGIIPTIFYWLKPWVAPWLSPAGQQFMLWLTLFAAIVALALGLISRKFRFGWQAIVIGGLNLVIWLLFFVAGQISASGEGGPALPEMLQDETLEIQRDGGIAFQLKASSINRSATTLDNDQFNASDFVHIEKITDEQGSPLRFKVVSDRANSLRYTVALEPPVPPAGRITTVTEGTIIGLIRPEGQPGVFEYRMDHYPGYEGVTHRIERHKLPADAQLVWKNTDDLHEEKVGDHIELHIDRRIPRHGDLDVRYRFKFPPQPEANSPASK